MRKLPKPHINIKNFKSRKLWLIAAAGILLVAGVAGALVFFVTNNQSRADCGALVQQSKELLKDNKTKEAYDILKSQEQPCELPDKNELKDAGKTAETIESIKFKGELAKAAYLSEDKQLAKDYAQKTDAALKDLSKEQREKIPDTEHTDLVYDMYAIKEGFYANSAESVSQ